MTCCPTGKQRRLKQAKEEAQAEIERIHKEKDANFRAVEQAVSITTRHVLYLHVLLTIFGLYTSILHMCVFRGIIVIAELLFVIVFFEYLFFKDVLMPSV